MNWTKEQIESQISALEWEYKIPSGEFLAIVRRESQDYQYQGKLHPDNTSRGLAGITPGAINEYENMTGNSFPDYMDNEANLRVGAWYIGKRIPQMLKHYDKPITLANKITAYNAGISYVVNDTPLAELPGITQDYIKYMQESVSRYSRLANYLGYALGFGTVAVFSGMI